MRKLKTMSAPDFKVKLVFHGALAKELCEELDAAIATPFEALKLIEANRRGITLKWLARGLFVLYLNDELVDNEVMYQQLKQGDVIHFVPVVAGAFWVIALAIFAVVVALASLYFAFTKPPETDLTSDSTSPLRPTNVVREGAIVPVVYGTTRVGSLRVSDNTFLGRSTETTGNPTIWPFLNDAGTLGAGIFEFDDGPAGSIAPVIITSDVSTSQQIHIISEGQISALTAENVLFDGTQLETGGTRNFNNVTFEFLDGSDPQILPPWIDASAAAVAINTELQTSRNITTLSDELDSVRIILGVTSFFRTPKKKPEGTSVQLKIEKRVTGTSPWTLVSQPIVSGEYFSEQLFQYVIELDNTDQFDIAVSRLNEPTNVEDEQDTITLTDLIEIKRDLITYDGSALVLLEYTNEAFGGNTPEIEFIPDGKIISIPSNYNPVTRIYTGIWDGTYITGFSNNPAFCVQDILESNIYGLGEKLTDEFDRFNIFDLGVFCDVLIDDGQGGTEPRYVLNIVINERKKAIETVRDVASVFRGQAIWDGSEITFFTEQSLSITRLLNNTQVVDGDFTYSGAPIQITPNAVTVTFFDENNKFEESSVTFKDHDSIREFGLNAKTFEGVGTTSPGQALRQAKYAVLTAGLTLSTEAIEDQADILPGEVTAVFDEKFMGESDRQGRTSTDTASTTTTVNINRSFTVVSGRTYELYVVLPDGTTEIRDITNAVGSHTAITLSVPLTTAPQAQAAWGIGADNLSPQFYIAQTRVNLKPSVGGSNGNYQLSFLAYDPDKLTIIEEEINFDNPPTTTNPNTQTVPPPENLTGEVVEYSEINGVRYDINLTWTTPDGIQNITGYDVFYTLDQGQMSTLATNTANATIILSNVNEGEFAFFVRTLTLTGKSDFTTVGVTIEDATTLLPFRIEGLELFGQGNNTVFENRDAKFVWRYVSELGAQEIGSERFGADSVFLDDTFKEFVIEIFDVNTDEIIRIEENIIVTEYTYTIEKNIEDGGPRREFRFEIFYRNKFNNASARSTLEVSNPAPPLPNNINVNATAGGIVISFTATDNLIDLAGYKIWGDTTTGFTPSPATLIDDTTSTTIYLNGEAGVTQFVRVAQYDTYSKDVDDLNISAEFFATPIDKLDTVPPAQPANLILSTDVITDISGTQTIDIIADWDRNTEADMNFYDLGIREFGVSDYITTSVPQVPDGSDPTHTFSNIRPSTTYEVRVRAIDDSGNKSGYTANASILSASDTTIPGTPTSLTAEGTFQSIQLTWVNPTDNDFLATRVYENTVDDFGTSTLIAQGSLNFFIRDDLATGVTRFYFVTAVDTSGNESPESLSVTATTQTVVTLDIEPLNITTPLINLQAIDTEQIALEAVTTATIEPLNITEALVAALAITETKIGDDAISTRTIIAGAITANEILAGTITADQIAANTITAGQIEANTITAGQIFAGTITANEIEALTITADQIAANTITANQILAGSLTAQTLTIASRNISVDGIQFEPNSPAANRLAWTAGTITYLDDAGITQTAAITAANTVAGTQIRYIFWTIGATTLSFTATKATAFAETNVVLASYTDDINLVVTYGRAILDGSQLITNSITATQIAALTITADQIAANTITAGQIEANTITADELAANSIISSKIIAGAITTDKMTAGTIDADRLQAGTILSASITVSGTALGDTTSFAEDPITQANIQSTQILPGLVLISGSTSLSDWRQGGDLTKIAGGSISANTVTANIVSVGSRNITFDELQFESNSPSSNRVSWSAGTISYTDDTGAVVTASIAADNSSVTSATRYIYWVQGASVLSESTVQATAFGANNVVIATYRGDVDLVVNFGRTIIDGSQIIANTITSNNLITGQAVITESAQIAVAIIGNAEIEQTLQSTDYNAISKVGIFIDFATGLIEGQAINIYDDTGTLALSSGTVRSVADGAVNARPTMLLLLNTRSSGAANPGEASLVGVSDDGTVNNAADGFFYWQGVKVIVNRNELDTETFRTGSVSRRGFMCWDTADTTPFTLNALSSNAAFVFKNADGDWRYDNNNANNVGTSFTPTDDMVALGWLETGSVQDNIAGGGLFGQPTTLETANFQMDATTISTFIAAAAIGTAVIADAAITNALIDNLAVTSAKIGDLEVDTIKVANDAITSLTSNEGADSPLTSSYVTRATVVVAGTSGDEINILATGTIFSAAYGGGDIRVDTRIQVNGVNINELINESCSINADSGRFSIAFVLQNLRTLLTSSDTFTFQLRSTGVSVSVIDPVITIFKRLK